jgi:hypothetical protein
MAGLIGKAKKLKREGHFGSADFKVVTLEENPISTADNEASPCMAAEMVLPQGKLINRCTSCHKDIKTAPAAPRLIPGSSYGDEIIIDATLSKYWDLIPMERYTSILARQGSITIPPQSLIAASIGLAQISKTI